MNADAVRSAMDAALQCGRTLLANVAYIREELPNVSLTPKRRAEIEAFCSNAAKHDMLGEIFDVIELLAAPTPDSAIIRARVRTVVGWLWSDISTMHALVRRLKADSQRDPEHDLGWMLVIGAETDVLYAFRRVQIAFDALAGDSGANK